MMMAKKPRAKVQVQQLACPICQTKNPVSKANVYLKCTKCGTSLRSVKVRRRK